MFVAKLNEVLSSKKSFLADPLNYVSLGIAGLLNIIHWLILFSKIKPSKTQILLHYNVVLGPDLISKSQYIYWIPLLALILLLINASVASIFYKKEKLAAYFLNISSIAVQLIFLVASAVLIIANAQ
ncbi:MAG: hypothetical protein WDN47_01410 [Candidatus Doudnabacteria bacterium]